MTDALGPNDAPNTSNDPYPASFSDLALEGFTQQVSSDVSSVTFTVANPTVYTARIALRYNFASEEYPEYVGDLYNDGAYIMVDGSIVSSVDVLTANFNDSTSSQVWEYDGYTSVASVVIEIPSGGSKVIKILVGDCRDSNLDSALLVQSEIAVKLATVTTSDGWTFYPFLNGGGSQQYFSTTSSIDISGLQNPAPQAVYRRLQLEGGGMTWAANNLSPGTYKVRVHLSSIETPYPISEIRDRLTVTGANGSFWIDVSPYGSGGYNQAMIEQFPQDFTPNASGQISGRIDAAPGYIYAVVSGVEVVKNP